MSTALATMPGPEPGALAPSRIAGGVEPVVTAIEALKAVRTFVGKELVKEVDYGVIPGTGAKPTLLKSGAEKIALYYQTRIEYQVERVEFGGGHVEFQVRCDLVARQSGAAAAQGYGSCSTMESRYRWRKAERACPHCGQGAIIKGKAEYGGGWVCFGKKGGCGAKFPDGDPDIEGQQTGRVENPDVWDQRNTVLKMAMKRALVSAVLSLGSLSEMFTQDVEDMEVYDLRPQAQPPAEPPFEPARKNGRTAPASPEPRRRDERTCWEVIESGVASYQAKLADEFKAPEAARALTLTTFQVQRHLVKHRLGQATNGLGNREVSKTLEDLYQDPKHRKAVQAELKAYLETAYLEARKNYAGETLDQIGEGAGDLSDDGDPDIDYPDEPGANG